MTDGEAVPEEPRTVQLEDYLPYVVDNLGGGYLEKIGDEFYHVQVEVYEERGEDNTLVPVEGEA